MWNARPLGNYCTVILSPGIPLYWPSFLAYLPYFEKIKVGS
jgi:hypothetical protein